MNRHRIRVAVDGCQHSLWALQRSVDTGFGPVNDPNPSAYRPCAAEQPGRPRRSQSQKRDLPASVAMFALDSVEQGSTRRLSPAVVRRVARIGARYRLDGELRHIAIDLLGVCPDDELPLEVSSWVQTATDSAVAGVRDMSLATLVEAIDALLAEAPPDVARRLNEAAIRHDVGII